MNKLFLSAALIFYLCCFAYGQNAPSSGDIVFTHIDADVEVIEFLTLTRLNLNSLGVTDRGVCSAGALPTNEDNFVFPSSGLSDIPAGTFVRIKWDGTGTNDLDATDGIITVFAGKSSTLSVSGEQIIIYTGTPTTSANCVSPSASNTFISGIDWGGNGWIATGEPGTTESYAPRTSTDFQENSISGSGDDAIWFSGSVAGDVSAVISNTGSGLRNQSNWSGTGTGSGVFTPLKNIKFQTSNYASGSISFSNITNTGFTIDASGLTFDNTNSDTRYIIVMRSTSAPDAPADRYSCYSSISGNFSSAPDVVTAVGTPPCASPTTGNGKVVYFDYGLPSSFSISNLGISTTYQVRVFAVNGNGYTSEIGSAGGGSQGSLPVTLIKFNVKEIDNTCRISWATAMELNNDFFAIERKTPVSEYEIIGTMNGAGNSHTIINYCFIDKKPVANSLNYYRIIQHDFNGDSEVFGPLSVRFGKTFTRVTPTPNPFDNRLTINFDDETVIDRIAVTNIIGEILFEKAIEENSNFKINTETWKPGNYFITLSGPGFSKTTRFVKF